MTIRAICFGFILSLAFIFGIHWPLASESLNAIALFLAATACAYPGALLAQKATASTVALELALCAAVLACALLGLATHPAWLAIGYVVHGAWDWAHHVELVSTRVMQLFPPTCATFDIAIAAYVLWAVA